MTRPTLGSWIKAARLRTLPLALSSVAMGGFVAAGQPGFHLSAVLMAALTTLLLQVLSNFANDLGDSRSGIDNAQRVGPKRTVQTGEISRGAMRNAVIFTALLALLSGMFLLFGVSRLSNAQIYLFLALGLAAITAAITYTLGRKPYGYLGLGDVFVFVFFGLLGVAGTYFVATAHMDAVVFLPAAAMGLWSTGVLNLNNMRDHANDRFSGKYTLVVKMGYHNALIYHILLVGLPFVLLTTYNILQQASWHQYLFFLALPLFARDLRGVLTQRDPAGLDPFLKRLALSAMLATLLFGIPRLF